MKARSLIGASLVVGVVTFVSSYALYVLGPHRRSFLPFVSELDFYGASRVPFTVGLSIEALLLVGVALAVSDTQRSEFGGDTPAAVSRVAAMPLWAAAAGLLTVALVNVPRSPRWHGRGALLAFGGMLAWGATQTVLGWVSPRSRQETPQSLVCRTVLVVIAIVAFRQTLEWFTRGLAEIHAGSDLMAFYRLVPRPSIFVKAAAAEWVLVLTCLGALGTVGSELGSANRRASPDRPPA